MNEDEDEEESNQTDNTADGYDDQIAANNSRN